MKSHKMKRLQCNYQLLIFQCTRRITCVGDFYGDPSDAYIDLDERFCITIGCGIIKYNLQEPYEEYMYDRDNSQWIEVGREGDDIEWCDRIEEVTDSYIIVSLEGEEKRRFNLNTLKKEEILNGNNRN